MGQAKAGVWASGQSGILWFFDRGNAEVLVKVLNGCSNNGHRWAFVAPVTTLEFNLWITGPNGRRWTHSNEQSRTAATKSNIRAFRCSDETGGDNGDDDDDGGGGGAPDLVVQSPSVSDTSPVADQSISFRATVRNVGDGAASSTTIRYYSSSNATISDSDQYISSDVVAALPASGTSTKTIQLVSSRSGHVVPRCLCRLRIGRIRYEQQLLHRCTRGHLRSVADWYMDRLGHKHADFCRRIGKGDRDSGWLVPLGHVVRQLPIGGHQLGYPQRYGHRFRSFSDLVPRRSDQLSAGSDGDAPWFVNAGHLVHGQLHRVGQWLNQPH